MGNDLLNISRFGIGTVQFGFDYGINNKTGKVSYPQVVKILEIAGENGVNFLDTSRNYGNSEAVLGRAFRELGCEFIVSTKLDLPTDFHDLSDKEIVDHTRIAIDRSLEALGLESIPIYLLHNYEYRTYRDGLIWSCVLEAVAKGLILNPGVSISGGPLEAKACLDDTAVRALQIPFNVFDQRWERAGIFGACADKDVILFNRSSYLQGLLLMNPDEAVAKVPVSYEYKRKLEEIAVHHSVPLKELVLRYVLGKKDLTSTIIGLDSAEQLVENLDLFALGSLSPELIRQIESAFQDTPLELVSPHLWKIQYPPPSQSEEKP